MFVLIVESVIGMPEEPPKTFESYTKFIGIERFVTDLPFWIRFAHIIVLNISPKS